MHRTTIRAAAAIALAVVLAATWHAGDAIAKKKGSGGKVYCADYAPGLTAGDERVWKIDVTVTGKEIYSGKTSWETSRSEIVQGPIEYFAGRKKKKKVQAWRVQAGDYHEVFVVKGGVYQLYEWRQEGESEAFYKPWGLKKKMKFGKPYNAKNKSHYESVDDEYQFDRKHRLTRTLYPGGAFEGDEMSFDDTIRVETHYVRESADATRTWIGDLEERFARGIGLVWQHDVWEFRDEYFGLFGTIRLEYDWTEELVYAKIGGVEYGDPSLR